MAVTPLKGDRSAFDVINHPDTHASDLEADTPIHHVPAPGDSGNVLSSDGSKWVSSAPAAGVSALDDLSDVNAPSPSDTQLLSWDGTAEEWIASDRPENLETIPGFFESYGVTWKVTGVAANSGNSPSFNMHASLGPGTKATTATTLSAISGKRTGTAVYKTGTGNWCAGLKFQARIAAGETSNGAYFFGFSTEDWTALNTDTPTGSHIGFWFRPSPSSLAHTNWQFMTRDGSTLHSQDTGVAVVATEYYDFTFYISPGGSTVYWTIKRLSTGTTTSGNKTDNIPAGSTLMYPIYCAINQTAGAARFIFIQRFRAYAYEANTA